MWIFLCILKVCFFLDNFGINFVAIELKKLLNSFTTTLLPVAIESFICEQMGAYLVWAFMLINTFIPCQIYMCFSYSFQTDS